MLAYQVTADGYGYKTDNNKFFWSNVSAGKFCEAQLYKNLLQSVCNYVDYVTKATALGLFYNTIRKDNAFQMLTRFVNAQHTQSLPELANQILDMEPHLRVMIPSRKHPYHAPALTQLNELIWLCIRIRKQFKKTQ